MKKNILISLLLMLFFTVSSFAQATVPLYQVKDGGELFKQILAEGSVIYDKSTNVAWELTAVVPVGASLNTTATKIYYPMGFNGNRVVKRAGLPAVNAGGTDLFTWINNYFFPFIPATISCGTTPTYISPVAIEAGNTQIMTVSGLTTANDEITFSNGKLYKDLPLPQVNLFNFGASLSYSTSYTYVPLSNIAEVLTFHAEQNVANNGSPTVISSPTKTVNVVYTYLYGVSASDFSGGGNPAYVGLTKLIQVYGNKTVTLTGINGYIYFAYPASYGDLTDILDQNGFSVLPSFTKNTKSIISSGLTHDYTVSYNIYKLNSPTSPAGWSYQFIY